MSTPFVYKQCFRSSETSITVCDGHWALMEVCKNCDYPKACGIHTMDVKYCVKGGFPNGKD